MLQAINFQRRIGRTLALSSRRNQVTHDSQFRTGLSNVNLVSAGKHCEGGLIFFGHQLLQLRLVIQAVKLAKLKHASHGFILAALVQLFDGHRFDQFGRVVCSIGLDQNQQVPVSDQRVRRISQTQGVIQLIECLHDGVVRFVL